MTFQDLASLRKRLDLTQAEMAGHIGLSMRAYHDVETGASKLRPIHTLAAERAALALAAERGGPMLAPASGRRRAVDLARLITGEAESRTGADRT